MAKPCSRKSIMAKPLSFDFLPYLTGLQFQGRTQCRRLPALCGVWGRVGLQFQGILIISYEIQVISYFLTL